jgi:hypothetical protein
MMRYSDRRTKNGVITPLDYISFAGILVLVRKVVVAVPDACDMNQYFAVLDNEERHGPFDTIGEACRLLKQTSRDRGYTQEQAQKFFLHGSAVEQVDTVNGHPECFQVGWLAREQSGRLETSSR